VAERHGGQTAGGVHYRIFAKHTERDETSAVAGRADDWRLGHLGFRAGWQPRPQGEFTLQGDLYRGTIGQLAPAVSITGRTVRAPLLPHARAR